MNNENEGIRKYISNVESNLNNCKILLNDKDKELLSYKNKYIENQSSIKLY